MGSRLDKTVPTSTLVITWSCMGAAMLLSWFPVKNAEEWSHSANWLLRLWGVAIADGIVIGIAATVLAFWGVLVSLCFFVRKSYRKLRARETSKL